VLTSRGRVKCWGANDRGQLGNGSTTDSSTPVAVRGLEGGVIAISAGGEHTCALTSRGGVKCWGLNRWGELGNGKTAKSRTPVDVSGLTSGVSAIAAGGNGTCAIVSDGGVKCWGMGNSGQLGNGANTDSLVPVDVDGLAGDVSAIAAGGWHTCALVVGAEVMCWGTDAYWSDGGEGPLPWDDTIGDTAVAVAGLPNGVSAISAGAHHTCALTTGGGVTCWGGENDIAGYNGSGNKLGIPGEVAGLASGVTAIAAGGSHTCVLMAAGGVKCWGTVPVDVVFANP
jgi:alpha-tubulin suppressor-like RCC1 family protein